VADAQGGGNDELTARLEAVVRDVLAPLVAVDRGLISWLGVREGVAEIELGGACAGCPGQHFTAQGVVLPALRAVDPAIKSVKIKTVVV
jgi:Fe-S cluster biogenesis protein NfuA